MIEHHDHHTNPQASGTGGHDHHRRVLEAGGVRTQYWACDKSPFADRHCPDEPDPRDRLIMKLSQAVVPEPVEEPVRLRCRYGHGPEHQTLNNQGAAICVECRRLASLKSRMKRAADRIAA